MNNDFSNSLKQAVMAAEQLESELDATQHELYQEKEERKKLQSLLANINNVINDYFNMCGPIG